MKKIFIAILLMALAAFSSVSGQDKQLTHSDSAAITQTALDYIEGYFTGDAARMERAVHPDLNKATPVDLPQTGRTTLAYTTYSTLVELTRAGTGILPDTARHISVEILDIGNDVANVKVPSARFIDYLQELKIDGQWKIVNVIFSSLPPRLKNFDPEMEKEGVAKTAMLYLAGLTGGDAGKIQVAIDPEFSKISLNPKIGEANSSLRRQRYEAVMEYALAGLGKQDEIYRNNRVEVLDINDGLAIVKCQTTGSIEYVQMFKGDGEWKLFNSIARPNPPLTLEQAMTPIVGEPMPDFSLPVYGGGEFKLSVYRGQNVLLMFPRGWVGNSWCSYCPYQYLELEKLVRDRNILVKNNMVVAFVMPYSSDRIKDWMEKFPDALKQVERLKNPDPAPAAGSIQAEYSAWVNHHFPLVFDVKKDDPHDVIPVLVDEDRTLSRNLKIFTSFWDGISSEQNMASVIIIDKKGVLRLKYIGQMTEDRPDLDYLLDYISTLN